jgi:GTP cyclohydrolase I
MIYKMGWAEVKDRLKSFDRTKKYYGIPRGGSVVAAMLNPVDTIAEADFIIDDIYDSGATACHYKEHGKPLLFLIDKRREKIGWVEFPWERAADKDIEDSIIRIFEYLGQDIKREGLKDTPRRMVKSWEKLFGGYMQDPKNFLTIFKDDSCDEMVMLKDIDFYSTCEHHFLPFFGKVHIGYIPNGSLVGVSKLARLVETYSRRLQIQERMTTEIADSIQTALNPKGVMVVAMAQHFCIKSRGVEKQNAEMITSSVRGVFSDNFMARQEFLSLLKG